MRKGATDAIYRLPSDVERSACGGRQAIADLNLTEKVQYCEYGRREDAIVGWNRHGERTANLNHSTADDEACATAVANDQKVRTAQKETTEPELEKAEKEGRTIQYTAWCRSGSGLSRLSCRDGMRAWRQGTREPKSDNVVVLRREKEGLGLGLLGCFLGECAAIHVVCAAAVCPALLLRPGQPSSFPIFRGTRGTPTAGFGRRSIRVVCSALPPGSCG